MISFLCLLASSLAFSTVCFLFMFYSPVPIPFCPHKGRKFFDLHNNSVVIRISKLWKQTDKGKCRLTRANAGALHMTYQMTNKTSEEEEERVWWILFSNLPSEEAPPMPPRECLAQTTPLPSWTSWCHTWLRTSYGFTRHQGKQHFSNWSMRSLEELHMH